MHQDQNVPEKILKLFYWLPLTLFLGCLPSDPNDSTNGDKGDAGSAAVDASSADAAGNDSSPVSFGEGILGGVLAIENHIDSQTPSQSSTLGIAGPKDHRVEGTIFGVVSEGHWEATTQEGSCVYLEAMLGEICDPACTEGYCRLDGECSLWPQYQNAGALTMTGFSVATTFTIGDLGYERTSSLVDDLFSASTTAQVVAQGGEFFPFSITGQGVDTIDPLNCDQEMTAGTDFVLTWTNPDPGARIRLELISMMHAGNGPMVLCESDDTGSITVPAAIVDRYLIDRTPYQTWQLSRFRRASAEVAANTYFVMDLISRRICFFLN